MTGVVGLDHVQLACPAGSEGRLCSFYAGLLGMEEVPKPPALATRGGAWFRAGTAEVHLGVEEPFRPARKAHPGLVVDDVGAVAARLTEAGHAVRWDDAVPGRRRFHTDDPVGNRVEILGRRPLGEAGGCGSARPSGALQGTCAW